MSEDFLNKDNNEFVPENDGENAAKGGESGSESADSSENGADTGSFCNPSQNNPYSSGGDNHAEEEPKQAPVEYTWDYSASGSDDTGSCRKKGSLGRFVGFVLAAAIIAFAIFGVYSLFENGIGFVFPNNTSSSDNVNSVPNLDPVNRPTSSQLVSDDGEILSSVQVAKKVRPSVVSIMIYSDSASSLGINQAIASGSGIIISEDGYIITNAHVVSGAKYIEVTLSDSSVRPATLIGSDVKTDIAIVKISATGLVKIELGNSDDLEVAEYVMAIGNPGGLSGSVSMGIVSALNRPVTTSYQGYTMECIQVDAAINPGNSGGALVDMYGRLVGINSSKIADVDYEGIGFAIPVNTAVEIARDLIANGKVTGRGKLGITAGYISDYYATMYGVKSGYLVQSIEKSSGLYGKVIENDIITHFNGKALTSDNSITDALRGFKAGDSVTVTVFRKIGSSTDTFDVTVKLIEE